MKIFIFFIFFGCTEENTKLSRSLISVDIAKINLNLDLHRQLGSHLIAPTSYTLLLNSLEYFNNNKIVFSSSENILKEYIIFLKNVQKSYKYFKPILEVREKALRARFKNIDEINRIDSNLRYLGALFENKEYSKVLKLIKDVEGYYEFAVIKKASSRYGPLNLK